MSARGFCAIAGIGRTEYSKDSGRSELALASEAARAAVSDAGLRTSDIDGVIHCDFDNVKAGALAGALALPGVGFTAAVGIGGSAPCAMVGVAAAAVSSGQAKHVLVYRSLNGRSQGRLGSAIAPSRTVGGMGSYDEFFTPYGLLTAPQSFALLAQRHAELYGTQDEHFGAVAIACREHANRTPHAQMNGRPMTLDDYLAAPVISTPLRLFDCCLETDGAAALVVTSTERARDLAAELVTVRAVASATPSGMSGGMMFPSICWEDPLTLGMERCADKLWERAGLGPHDIDVAQIYDCFTISVLLQLEGYGFCEKGGSGPFAASGAIRHGGTLPINTDGGNMSGGYVHGVNHVVEGVRQMRGTSDVQVEGARTCLVTSGPMGPTSALVLERGA